MQFKNTLRKLSFLPIIALGLAGCFDKPYHLEKPNFHLAGGYDCMLSDLKEIYELRVGTVHANNFKNGFKGRPHIYAVDNDKNGTIDEIMFRDVPEGHMLSAIGTRHTLNNIEQTLIDELLLELYD